MSEKFCDILIVGCELSGLITGVFLAKRGLSVIVLNSDHDVGMPKKNIQPNLISHLDSRLFKTILGRLSIADAELGIVNRYDTPYQVVFPDHRIDVTVQRDRFYKELKREFPQNAEAIRSFYSSLDELDRALDNDSFQDFILPRGIIPHFKFKQFIKENHLDLNITDWINTLNLDPKIASFMDAQIKFLSNLHCEVPFSYPLAKLLANQNSVLFDVKGGIGQLKKLFMTKIEAFNGKIKNDVQIDNVLIERRRVQGVKLGGFEGMIACKYLLWNQSSTSLEPWLPKSIFSKFLLRRIKKTKPKFARFSIEYEIASEVIPVGMKSNVLYVKDPQKPLLGSNFLHLHFYYPTEVQENNPTKALIVTYLLPHEALQQDDASFDAIHEEITKHLQELMPFSQGKIELKFPADDPEPTGELLFPLEESDYETFKRNAAQNPIYEVQAQKFQELFPFPHRTLYKNLILTGPEILSALGCEGEFLLGLKTTDYIWGTFEKVKKKGIKQRRIA